MAQFRQIMWVALLAGAISGLALFALQHLTLHPLIASAENYEDRAAQVQDTPAGDVDEHAAKRAQDASPAEGPHEWQPAEGWQRTGLTALSSVLTGIGFAALLFGLASLWSGPMTASRGLRWGLAGCACFVLAPALGLPPEPPGVVAADLAARQIWWVATVISTAGGLLLLSASHRDAKWRWLTGATGIVAILLPHFLGSPNNIQSQIVPDDLVRKFQIVSITTNSIFWLLLGTLGGWLSTRLQRTSP